MGTLFKGTVAVNDRMVEDGYAVPYSGGTATTGCTTAGDGLIAL